MTVTRVDPWTVLRLSFLLSIAAAIITVVAVVLLWAMLSSAGVFSSVDNTLVDVLGADNFYAGNDVMSFHWYATNATQLSGLLAAEHNRTRE